MMFDPMAICVRYLTAPMWAWRDGGPSFAILRELEETQYLSPQELRTRQLQRLRSIMGHAAAQSHFYQRRFEAADLKLDSFNLEDFQRIAPLTKADVRAHRAELIAGNFPRQDLVAKKTGGSTSVPLEFYIDKESNARKRSCAIRHNRWAGWELGDKVAMIWGATDLRANWRVRIRNWSLDRAIALDTLRLSPQMMHNFAREMIRFKPKVVFGHSHSIYILACFLKNCKYSVSSVGTVISTSTVLSESERRVIEGTFNCPVFDRYGCEETSLIASECKEHSGLHMNVDHLLIEFIKDGRPANPGECGEIYLTDLTNYAMPFIRYRVEDAGTPSSGSCKCGRGLPLMEKVQGRVADFIVTPEGDIVFGVSVLDNFTAKFGAIERVQIIQDKIDHLQFRIVRGEQFSDSVLRSFQEAIPKFFGSRMRYEIDFVDEIKREASGKYRFTISLLPNPLEQTFERVSAD